MSQIKQIRYFISEILSSTGGLDARGFNDKYPGTITRSDREAIPRISKSNIPQDMDDLSDHLIDDDEDTIGPVPRQERGTRVTNDPLARGTDLVYGRLGV